MTGLSTRAKLLATLALGAAGGGAAVSLWPSQPRLVQAASSDRYQDSVICTGAVSLSARLQLDGVWMIDYRAGKLLGTVIDKSQGKIVGWAEVDLVSEFGVTPRQDVHFMMATGYITQGQAALYIAETVTGKFGVYTMSGAPGGVGVVIRRHDLTTFRRTAEEMAPGAAPAPGLPTPIGEAIPAGAVVPAPPPAPTVPPPATIIPAPVPVTTPATPVPTPGMPAPGMTPSGGRAVPTIPPPGE